MKTILPRFRQPYWLTIFMAFLFALLATISLLIDYGMSRQWQYAALSGLAGLIVLASLASWWIAQTYRRHDIGIWLVAGAQIISVLSVPFFVSSYALVGIFLLAIVTLEIAVADKLSQIPRIIVICLLSAACMVAIDLLAPPDRLAVLTDYPITNQFVVLIMLLHQISLIGMLWYFRLRAGARYHIRLDLTTQQSLVFIIISAAAIIVVTGVLIDQIRRSQIAQVGQNFRTLAEINAERVGNTVDQQIINLSEFGRRSTLILDGLTAANAAYPDSTDAAQRVLAEKEQRWLYALDNDEFVLSYRSNPITLELSKFRGADLLQNNVFLTDRMGGLVAAQGERPRHFDFGRESWWQTAWNNSKGGVYIGQLHIDPETKLASVFIAVSVLNPLTNQNIGVLASLYQLRAVQRDITAANNQSSGEVTLIGSDGTVIAGFGTDIIGKPAWQNLLTSGTLPTELSALERSSWLLGTDYQNKPAVVAYAPLSTTSGVRVPLMRSLGWVVLVSNTQSSALAEVTRSTQIASLVGLLVLALGVLAASAMVRVVTRPIEALTRTAAAISAGNLEQRAEPVGPVELVTLAESFNTLTDRLRSLINSLEDQVKQRTLQLEERVEQLATLNRITQMVGSVRDLEPTLMAVAEEIARLLNTANCGIALLDPENSKLTVLVEYDSRPNRARTHSMEIPVFMDENADADASTQVVRTGRSMVVQQPHYSLFTDQSQAVLQQRQTANVMIVPLLSRGRVVGTLTVVSKNIEHEFSPAEVNLAETIAGQIAGALENARLFNEMEKAKEAAEAANESKSAFLASVSHELRTPLTSILGFAKIIQKRQEERIFPALANADAKTLRAVEQVRENVNIIATEGERLTTLINNVLDLSKIEAGKIEWQMQRLSPADVIEHATTSTAALFEQRPNIVLIKDVPDNLPEIVGDRDRLIQVVINLLSNAVKFTEEGSVTCSVRQGSADLVVSVIDTGIGIAPEHQATIFEKFTQVGDTLTDKPTGTGLGLPICKEIVEYHGGRIWVESAIGHGSKFSFTLPLVQHHD